TLGGQDSRAAIPFRAHLLLHRVLDGDGRVDGLQLDARDADSPLARRLVEHDTQLAVDLIAAGERLLQVEATDDVAEGRGGELLDGAEIVRDLIGRGASVGDLEVDDRVDRDDEVVLGDHRLRRKGHDLLAHVDERAEAIDEGNQQIQPRREGLVIAAEPLHDAGGRLGDDPNGADDRHQDEDDDGDGEDPPDRGRDEGRVVHGRLLLIPSRVRNGRMRWPPRSGSPSREIRGREGRRARRMRCERSRCPRC
ncbi:hypothetical protein ABE10_01120, partial [Bacillus toyonensis]|nr:hypothetical protein [Bacillus toyonensis]